MTTVGAENGVITASPPALEAKCAATPSFDASGIVTFPKARMVGDRHIQSVRWPDLSPFVQGYVEALFESLRKGDLGYLPLSALKKELRFDRLAPESLARIMEDCAEDERVGRQLNLAGNREDRASVKAGRKFWTERQEGNLRDAPPLTPYLGDDGKVYLREAGQ